MHIYEAQLEDDIQSLLEESINNTSVIKITVTEVTAAAEANLNLIIQRILQKYAAADLFTTVSLTLKELVTNAAKANLKQYLRSQPATAITSPTMDFMAEFRRILTTNGMHQFVPALRAAGLDVRICLEFDRMRLKLTVTNNFALSESDKQRLQNLLTRARNCPDLRKLHEQNKADAEGAGLGMVLVMNALKSAGIDPNALTFDLGHANLTIVEVVFPFQGRPITSDNAG